MPDWAGGDVSKLKFGMVSETHPVRLEEVAIGGMVSVQVSQNETVI